MVLHVKLFCKCIITHTDFDAIPWMSCQSGQGEIYFLQLNSVSQHVQHLLHGISTSDGQTNSWMWCFSNHVPTGLANYWWQQMTDCKLLISILWPLLAAADICSCSEFCVDRLFFTLTMYMGIWKVLSVQSAYLSIQKQDCREVFRIQFVYFANKNRIVKKALYSIRNYK